MLIRWHGHACFELRSEKGVTVVIDPHDGYSLGIEPPDVKADYILITHEHFDHNATNVVAKPTSKIVRMRSGEFSLNDIKVVGVRAYHDRVRGRRRGEVVMYRLLIDGIYVTHLGDLGHVLTDEQIKKLTPTNVLLIPVGGTFTIEPHEAWEVARVLRPNIVVPMHYWVSGMNLPLKPVDNFLKLVTWEVIKLGAREFEITKESLPTESRVFLLKY